jgi:hypothetical protein
LELCQTEREDSRRRGGSQGLNGQGAEPVSSAEAGYEENEWGGARSEAGLAWVWLWRLLPQHLDIPLDREGAWRGAKGEGLSLAVLPVSMVSSAMCDTAAGQSEGIAKSRHHCEGRGRPVILRRDEGKILSTGGEEIRRL